VAVTLAGGTATLYVNGAAVASAPSAVMPAEISQTSCWLGKSQFAADPLFKGAITDFRLYNRGLSAAEVAALANPPAAAVSAPPDYAAWAAGFPFAPGADAAAADPDGDGTANLLEYLFGSDPLTSGPGPELLTTAAIRTGSELGLSAEADAAKHFLTLQARLRAMRPGITLTAEAADSPAGLADPEAAARTSLAGTPVADGDFEMTTFRFTTALEDSPTGTAFIRLRASRP
jgi:hypothetical protein